MANIVVSALATWNGKALKKGKQDITVFDKQLKGLARTLGITFSAATLIAFSKKAVKAFSEDQAAAKSLQLQLENTGNAFRVTEVEAYIKGLEKTFAILTDLRAPFQTFLNLTGSVALAQRSLEASLNISAGTGQSLTAVVGALAAGIRGQTKAIKGLNTGIDDTVIASGDMNDIMSELEKRFTGQASARLDTYAGKMDALRKSSDEATKIIGTGLVDALTILGEDNSIQSLSEDMENFAVNIALATTNLAKLIDKLGAVTSSASFKPALLLLGGAASVLSGNPAPFFAAFAAVGAMGVAGLATTEFGGKKTTSNFQYGAGNPRADLLISKNLIKARKEEFKIITASNKAKSAVDLLKDKFDLERIGLTAALNAATDEETKLRLRSQLAILDNNEALAKKLLAEMEAAEGAKKLATALGTVGDATIEYFKKLAESLVGTMAYFNMSMQQILAERLKESGKTSLGGGMTGGGFTPLTAGYFQNLGTQLQGSSAYAGMSAGQIALERARESGNRSLDVNLVVSAPSGNAFAQLVAESIQVAGRDGYSTAPNGGLP